MTTTDYSEIYNENQENFLNERAKIVKNILAPLHNRQTHFILELLQNAEDALKRRPQEWQQRKVSFELTRNGLRFSHFGSPFTRDDVSAICALVKSSKIEGGGSIGRFGVGFKSVYRFTDRPVIFSGQEEFAIEDYGRPVPVEPNGNRFEPDRTVFSLPFSKTNTSASSFALLAEGLNQLDALSLLFLTEIKEICWNVEGEAKRRYERVSEDIDDGVRRVLVKQMEETDTEVSSAQWIVFSRTVQAAMGACKSTVEIAFAIDGQDPGKVKSRPSSPVVVYFPTDAETNMGFLLQGPFLTTPSRENLAWDDPRNKQIVKEASLLVEPALLWLRNNALLDVDALCSFPLDKRRIQERDGWFSSFFEESLKSLKRECLLPRFNDGHIRAEQALLGSSKEVRELLSPVQLRELFEAKHDLYWLHENISDRLVPDLCQFLCDDLGIKKVTPGKIVHELRLRKTFLETQSDAWIIKLYSFLNSHQTLSSKLTAISLIRLEDGKHVSLNEDRIPDTPVFLPSKDKPSYFQTVRSSICENRDALRFLKSLGMRESDPVDEVIGHVLPKYGGDMQASISKAEYAADIELVLTALAADRHARYQELVVELGGANIVAARHAEDGAKTHVKPHVIFVATEEERKLFAGVRDAYFIDSDHECLREEKFAPLFKACKNTVDCVDVVMDKVLALYSEESRVKTDEDYRRDIRCIALATRTLGLDNKDEERPSGGSRPGRFVAKLCSSLFLKAVDLGTRQVHFAKPDSVYRSFRRQFLDLFEGVPSVLFVLEQQSNLDENELGMLLELCGVASSLRPVKDNSLDEKDKAEMRTRSGQPTQAGREESINWRIAGLTELLYSIPNFPVNERRKRAKALWEELALLDGKYFQCMYGWGPNQILYKARMDSAFVRQLQEIPWIPDEDGGLNRPRTVRFDTLGWQEDKFLQTTISFKSPRMEALALETGIDLDVIKLLQEHNLTSSELKELLEQRRDPSGDSSAVLAETFPKEELENGTAVRLTPRECGDSDELVNEGERQRRLRVEEAGIAFILEHEPNWCRTLENNPGFDLDQTDAEGRRFYCEVKSKSGTLDDMPAEMTPTQFRKALEKGTAYWLYIVENALSRGRRRIVKIWNPASHVDRFQFGNEWKHSTFANFIEE